MTTGVFRTESETETARLAVSLASGLSRGAVVLLVGELGAGKTAFVRGLAAGLGVDANDVSSPTFTLIQEYRFPTRASQSAREPPVLAHVDLYRLDGPEVDDLGLDELTESGAVVAIEWAEKLGAFPTAAILVTITDLGGNVREVRIEQRAAGAR